jgi:hypothetical protein
LNAIVEGSMLVVSDYQLKLPDSPIIPPDYVDLLCKSIDDITLQIRQLAGWIPHSNM